MNLLEMELVRLARRGNKKAFEKIFLMEKEYLYKCAFLYMKNREDALDLVQTCIVKCMVSMDTLKEPKYFRTWMTRILINCANTEWKKQQKYDLEEKEEIFLDKEELSIEEKMDLYDAIDYLKFPYKEIIVQHYFAGNTLGEIAAILDMPIGTIKAYHAKAKIQLKELMEVKL